MEMPSRRAEKETARQETARHGLVIPVPGIGSSRLLPHQR